MEFYIHGLLFVLKLKLLWSLILIAVHWEFKQKNVFSTNRPRELHCFLKNISFNTILFLAFIEVEFIYNVVLTSEVEQSESAIYYMYPHLSFPI